MNSNHSTQMPVDTRLLGPSNGLYTFNGTELSSHIGPSITQPRPNGALHNMHLFNFADSNTAPFSAPQESAMVQFQELHMLREQVSQLW